MNISKNVQQLTVSAILCAIGIIIPMFSPLKILIEPASFTLASHVAVFIAMFISPVTAISVSIGTTIGFLLGGFPPVVVARAATHIIFSTAGAVVLTKKQHLLNNRFTALLFSFLIGVIHGVCEVLVVIPFYFGFGMDEVYYSNGFFTSVVLLVGIGSIVHSMVDFEISYLVWKPIRKSIGSFIPKSA